MKNNNIPFAVLAQSNLPVRQNGKKGPNFNDEQLRIRRKEQRERENDEITRKTVIQVLGISGKIIADHFSQLIRKEVDGKDRTERFLELFYGYLNRIDENEICFSDIEKYLKFSCGITIGMDGMSNENPYDDKERYHEDKSMDYNIGFEDGILASLRTVLNAGVKGLEQEIRFRDITDIHGGFTVRDLDKQTNAIKCMTMDTTRVMATAALHDVLPEQEMNLIGKFNEKYDEGTAYLMKGYATWMDYIQSIKEETGLELKIRENN